MRTLIQGGTVVTATETTEADVVIEDEKVAAIGRGMTVEADRVIDATGRYVMPGGVDVHTHMELPFGGSFCSDDFETGTRAAAFGGTTTIVDFALQDYGEGLRQGLDRWFAKAQNAVTDYGFHVIIREVNDQVLKEMDELVGEGVTSFKLFMAYPGVFMLDDASIFRAMRQAGQSGALIMMHAENGGPIDVLVRQFLDEGKTAPVNHGLTRPAVMEGEAVHRVFRLAELAGTPAYIVHLSSRDALNALREARDRGQAAYAETCPQYLYLSQDDMAKPGFEGAKYVCSPPLRTADHQEDLWMGLRGGDLSVVSTDHAPFNYTGQKDLGKDDFSKIPNGLPSVEDRFTLLYGGVREGPHRPEPVRGAGRDGAGEDVRPVPAQGHDRPRLGRRHRGVRRDEGADDLGVDAPHARRLLRVRRHGSCAASPRSSCSAVRCWWRTASSTARPGQGRFVPRSRITA